MKKIIAIALLCIMNPTLGMDPIQQCPEEMNVAPGITRLEVSSKDIEFSLKTDDNFFRMMNPDLMYLKQARYYQIGDNKEVVRLDEPTMPRYYKVWKMITTDTPVRNELRADNKLVMKIKQETAIFIGTKNIADVSLECEKILAE